MQSVDCANLKELNVLNYSNFKFKATPDVEAILLEVPLFRPGLNKFNLRIWQTVWSSKIRFDSLTFSDYETIADPYESSYDAPYDSSYDAPYDSSCMIHLRLRRLVIWAVEI